MADESLIPAERLERAILVIRSHKVKLDYDLADYYGVTAARVNEQVVSIPLRHVSQFSFGMSDRASKSRSAVSKVHFKWRAIAARSMST
jgi:hypothetical protein